MQRRVQVRQVSTSNLGAGLLALWLMLLAVTAPVHELEHVAHADEAVVEHCEFFAHQADLTKLLGHSADTLRPAIGYTDGPTLFSYLALAGIQSGYHSRAPPQHV